jgi:CBS domain-containing protein
MHPRVPRLTVGSVLRERKTGLPCIDSSFQSVDALRLLAEKNLAAVIVMDADRVAGIFSLPDFALATMETGLSAMNLPVNRVMTSCDFHASPDDSAQACLNLMDEHHLNYLPVQEAGNLIALLPRETLLTELLANYEKIFREAALDQQILFLRGTYSC